MIFLQSKELKTYFKDRNPLSSEFTFYSNPLIDSLKLINWGEVAMKLKEKEREKNNEYREIQRIE